MWLVTDQPDNPRRDLNLTPEHKTRLLSLGLSPAEDMKDGDEEERRTDLLYDLLASALPVSPTMREALPPVLREQSEGLRSVAGQPMGELVQSPRTDISTIRRIKDFAKESGTASTAGAETDAFLALYYAAIASALLFHDVKISKHPWMDLAQYFRSLAESTWVLPEFRDFLLKAHKYCQDAEGKGAPSL
jgi:hypothetical protein